MPGAVCPPEMANIDDRFCIDRWEDSLVEMMRRRPRCPVAAVRAARGRALAPRRERAQRLPAGVHQRGAGRASVRRGGQAPVRAGRVAEGLHGPEGAEVRLRERPCHGTLQRRRATAPCCASSRRWPSPGSLVGMTEMNDPRLNQLDQTLAPTGSHDQCTNDYGVFDMVGQPARVDERPERDVPGRLLPRHAQERRRVLVPDGRARVHVPRLLHRLPLLRVAGGAVSLPHPSPDLGSSSRRGGRDRFQDAASQPDVGRRRTSVRASMKTRQVARTDVRRRTTSVRVARTDVPRRTTSIRVTRTDVPRRMTSVRVTRTDVPRRTTSVRVARTDVPRRTTSIRVTRTDVPRRMTSVRVTRTDVPRRTTSVRVTRTDVPRRTTSVRVARTDIPRRTTSVRANPCRHLDEPRRFPLTSPRRFGGGLQRVIASFAITVQSSFE